MKTYRSAACRQWFRSLPCHVCGGAAQHHHEPITGRGMGLKGNDDEAVPLCFWCHAERHSQGRTTFWEGHGEDWRAVVSEYKLLWGGRGGRTK